VQIIKYPHPTLRYKSKPLKRVDRELKEMIAEMFDLMYTHDGLGLAANQVDLPYRVFVMNVKDESGDGQERVFINPVISRKSGQAEESEGCLSFPEIYAPVRRPERIVVSAYGLDGREFSYAMDGLYARAVQHEVDHLDGTRRLLLVLAQGTVESLPLGVARKRITDPALLQSTADLRAGETAPRFPKHLGDGLKLLGPEGWKLSHHDHLRQSA